MDYLKLKALACYLNIGFTDIEQHSYFLFRYGYCFFAVLNKTEYLNGNFSDIKRVKQINTEGKEYYIYKYTMLSWNKEKEQVQLIM